MALGLLDLPLYIQSTHDLEGLWRLVLLQIDALRAGITPGQMPAWLAGSASELHNPYTSTPMDWDVQQQAFVFEGREPQRQHPERSTTYRIRMQ